MSEEEEMVYRARFPTYHTERDCDRLECSTRAIKEIPRELAESDEWDMEPCSFCIGTMKNGETGYNKWSEFVNEARKRGN